MGTKRVIFSIIISLAAIALLSMLFFKWVVKQDTRQYKPIDALPDNACIIIEVESFERFATALNSNAAWQKLENIPWLSHFSKIVAFSDSLNHYDAAFQRYIGGNVLAAAYISKGSKLMEELYVIQLPNGVGNDEIFEFIKLQSIGIARTHYESIDGNTCISLEGEVGSYWFTYAGRLILVSSSKHLLQKALDKLKESGNQTNQNFQPIYASSAKGVAANIFINTGELAKIMATRENLNYLKGIADWVGLDVQLSDKQLLANGLISVSDSGKRFYTLLTRQQPLSFTLDNYMPHGTNFFVWYGISDISGFLNDYRDYIDGIGLTDPYNANLSQFLSEFGASLDEFLIRNFDNEICVVNVAPEGIPQPQWMFLFRAKSGSSAIQEIIGFAAKKNREVDEIKLNYSVPAIIIKNPIQSYIPALLGNHFLHVTDAYILLLENTLVFGPDVAILKQVAESYHRNNTLSRSDRFKQELRQLSSSSNLILYSAGLSTPALMDFTLMGKPLATNQQLSGSVSHLAWQVVGGTPKLFAMLVVSGQQGNNAGSEPSSNALSQSIWTCQLNAKPIGKIHLLKNHTNGEAELLVQDEDNAIYLISKEGHILWRRKINAPIKGDVSQADLFRNGKLQMLFVAGRQILAIDRNGGDVKGFPIALKAEPTSPLSVFDYDRNRSYRLLVACNNKKIYCYDGAGKPVTGWNEFSTEAVVTDRIGLVQLSGRDYIVVFDQNRPYLLNRKGTERVRIANFFCKASNAEFFLDIDAKGRPHIVTADTLGIVKRIFFDGRVESFSIKPFSANHTFRLIKGKSESYYAFMEGRTIGIYRSNGQLGGVVAATESFDPGQLQAISVNGTNLLVASAAHQLYFYRTDGKTYRDVSMPGTIPIHCISDKSNWFATLSKEHGIVCFAIK